MPLVPTARLRIAIACASLLAGVPADAVRAQPGPLPIRHIARFTTDDGLAQNLVLSVAQDRIGFIWVGTRRGLQRFDGRAFVSWSTIDPAAPADLADRIQSLEVDTRGHLWVATAGGVYRIDPRGVTTTRVLDHAQALALARDGRLWFLENGALRWLDPGSPSVSVRTAAQNDAWKVNATLAVSRAGVVWVVGRSGTGSVVTRFDPATGAQSTFRPAGMSEPLALTEDDEGRIWLAAVAGLAVLDPDSTAFRLLEPFRGRRTVGPQSDGAGGLLFATDDWLARVDGTGAVTGYWFAPDVFGVGALPTDMTVDREGGIWLATITRGILRLDVQGPVFEYRASGSNPPLPLSSDFVTALFERSDGTLWVGTLRGGAYTISTDWRRVEAFRLGPQDPGSIASGEIWDFEEDLRGTLWVATSAGICRVEGRALRCFAHAGGPITDIARDRTGMFWLGLFYGGLVSFDPATGRYGPVVPEVAAFSGDSPVLTVWTEPDSDHLWIGSESVDRVRISAGMLAEPLRRLPISGSSRGLVYDFHRDTKGELWLGSDHGLQKWRADAGRFDSVAIPELRESTVFSIAEDASGRLWLGTAHGLVEYTPHTGVARRYGRDDGFLGGELNRRTALVRRNGRLLFGGVYGLTEFDPERVTAPWPRETVVLTRWRRMTPRGAVDESIAADTLRLVPGDRAFTLEFATLAYAPTVGRRYRYRLDPLDADWIESADHQATYSTPGPGRYTFRVETGSGSAGDWAASGSTLVLDVIPPVWSTPWFRALLAGLLVLLLWTAHRLRLQAAVTAERLRLRISRDLHDELGAGLSSIALLSDSFGESRSIASEERAQLERISGTARAMVSDLREIVWAIDPQADRLEDILARMRDVASDLLVGVYVTFAAPPAAELSRKIGMTVRRDLILLFKEVLNNVARHARATEVRIEVSLRRDLLELTVADNGIGFDPAGVRAGTGLKSLRERAARMGGRLDLSSRPGGGTTARLTLKRT